MSKAKPAAREIQTSVQPMASRKPTRCFVRWNTPRSSASSANTNKLNRTQKSQFEGMGGVSEQPFYLADPRSWRTGRAGLQAGVSAVANTPGLQSVCENQTWYLPVEFASRKSSAVGAT